MSLLRRIADPENPGSWAARMRRKRFVLFLELLKQVPPPVRILDVGGTEEFWKLMPLSGAGQAHITVLNTVEFKTTLNNVTSVAGDACRLEQYAERSFDVVFSNSVIEHLGTLTAQQQMSAEVRRVGRRYFIQTPNRWFPMEPHFLFPCFQFLPFRARVWIASHYPAGWYCRPGDPAGAAREVEAIRLLGRREFQALFPEGILYRERFCGLTKSFILYGGWDPLPR